MSDLQRIDFPDSNMRVDMDATHEEFTCICPFNGLRDHAKLTVYWVAQDGISVELGSLRAFLDMYRDVAISHEELVTEVAEAVSECLYGLGVTVTAEWAPVEGLKSTTSASTGA